MILDHDFHVHTHLSYCAEKSATIANYIQNAKRLGLKKIGISDHVWDEAWKAESDFYRGQNLAHISKIREEIQETDLQGVRVYMGCEAEYNPETRSVALTELAAREMDYILVPNSHTHMQMPKNLYTPYESHVQFMLRAFQDIVACPVSSYITAVAHPFAAICCPYDNRILMSMITDDQYRECFFAARDKNIAIEINLAVFEHKSLGEIIQDESLRMFRIAKECGCRFTIGTDSHSKDGQDIYDLAYVIATVLDLTEGDWADIVRQ